MGYALNSHDASLSDVLGGQVVTIKMAAVIGTFSLALSGCGTAVTVLQDDATTAKDLRKRQTYCQSLPRVYSGLAYDFCILDSPPGNTAGTAQLGFIPLIFFDLVASGVLDTVILPYTIYRQSEDGSLWIK
jgi:uncharacterized protein YceK